MTATQKMAIERIRILSRCISTNIEIIPSDRVRADGTIDNANGFYDPKEETIFIYLDAGKEKVDGMFDYALVESLSHEVLHFIKKHSVEDYYALRNFLQKNVYSERQWNSMVKARQAQYNNNKIKTTYESAEEEVVANACQTMFNSPRVLRALAKDNYTLFERIKLRVKAFFDKVSSLLGKYVNYTPEARAVMASTKNKQKAIEKLFVDAVRNANLTAQSTIESTQNAESQEQEIKASLRESIDENGKSEYNLTQKKNLKNGENKNEQSTQDTGVLERGSFSTSGRSGNDKREQGYDSRNNDDLLEDVAKARQRKLTESRHERKAGTWLSGSEFGTKEEWIRFRKTLLRNWAGRIADTDASGRRLSNDVKTMFKDSIFKNENGELLSLYHWTAFVFADFARGDVGFHFGTKKAAEARRSSKPTSQIGADITKEVYINIKNHIFLEDNGFWDAQGISYQLWLDLMITDEEQFRLSHLRGAFDGEYNDEASVEIRKLLEEQGYDGIIYFNSVEDKGSLSIAAFHPEQVYTVAENGVDLDHDNIAPTNNHDIKHSLRERSETHTREELANFFESIAQSKHEKSLVRQYRDNIAKQNQFIEELKKLCARQRELRGQKGSEAAAKRSELNAKIKNLSERISRYDLQLLNLQTSKPLREAMRKYVSEAVEREHIASKAHYQNIIKKIRQKRDKQLEELKAKHKKAKK